uniref:Uncharacterized protein n=1 Tax=Meloidogyne javanica TaxID=6303 RepID=A0A915MG65_MELJA
MTTSAAESKSYPIDDCFGKSIGRENLDKLTSLNLNEDNSGDGEMITFVEFIRGQKKKKNDGILRNEAFEIQTSQSHNYESKKRVIFKFYSRIY